MLDMTVAKMTWDESCRWRLGAVTISIQEWSPPGMVEGSHERYLVVRDGRI